MTVVAGCHPPDGEIGIGVIAMLEGQNALNGQNMRDAAALAAKAVNDRGGLRVGEGRVKVSLLVENDPNTPEGALDAARKLLSLEKWSHWSGPSSAGTPSPLRGWPKAPTSS